MAALHPLGVWNVTLACWNKALVFLWPAPFVYIEDPKLPFSLTLHIEIPTG